MDAAFTIRPLTTFEQCVRVRELQSAIWGLGLEETIYPPLLLSISQNGGIVLGAFAPSEDMIGFLFGYLARSPGGPLKLWSQTMGMVPAWRGQGVGYALKMEQRRLALEAGLPLITWTYDPLLPANAYLNLHKLAAVTQTYKRDVYGANFGALNRGLPTDRVLVEWWIEPDPATVIRPPLSTAKLITETTGTIKNLRLVNYTLEASDVVLAIEIPADFQQLKALDLALAASWREGIRIILETYFARGYVAVDFIRQGEGERARNTYVLEKKERWANYGKTVAP